jgi:SagB-type dehydrogenase family enzyme
MAATIGVFGQSPQAQDLVEIFHEDTKYFPTSSFANFQRIKRFVSSRQKLMRATKNKKSCPTAPGLHLPEPGSLLMPLQEALERRQSGRNFCGHELTMLEIATLMFHGLGRIRPKRHENWPRVEFKMRPYPSAGALFPQEFYLILLRASETPKGVYHYDIEDRRLSLVSHVHEPSLKLAMNSSDKLISTASAILCVTGVVQRTTEKYCSRGYRFMLLEIGHAVQNFMLSAAALGLTTLAWGGFFDDRLNEILMVDGVDEYVVATAFLGRE